VLERVLRRHPGDVATPQEDSLSKVEVTVVLVGEGWDCMVTVRDRSETHHHVHVSRADLARLAPGASDPMSLVEASFAFLLEREPQESILREFDLTVIGRYFPDYEREIGRRLTG
jgi:hypothetical protein